MCALENFQWCGEFILQALQFQQMVVCRELPGGASISHYIPNEFFVEDVT
jgi:hypothetical protein